MFQSLISNDLQREKLNADLQRTSRVRLLCMSRGMQNPRFQGNQSKDSCVRWAITCVTSSAPPSPGLSRLCVPGLFRLYVNLFPLSDTVHVLSYPARDATPSHASEETDATTGFPETQEACTPSGTFASNILHAPSHSEIPRMMATATRVEMVVEANFDGRAHPQLLSQDQLQV